MKRTSIILFFILAAVVSAVSAQGGYTASPYAPQTGPTDTLGADGTISFFELPLWIQLTWIAGALVALFGAIKFGPLLIGKIRIVLQNKNRAAILDYIDKNPGCTLADLSKNSGVNRGTAKYHLFLLLIEQKIVRKKYGKMGYLFTNGGMPLEKKRIYGYIMNPAKREILTAILSQPGITNGEIANRLKVDPSTTHWHLQQLLEEKMVASQKDGRIVSYVLFPEVETILREHTK